jgi:hypothetical protein
MLSGVAESLTAPKGLVGRGRDLKQDGQTLRGVAGDSTTNHSPSTADEAPQRARLKSCCGEGWFGHAAVVLRAVERSRSRLYGPWCAAIGKGRSPSSRCVR